jgi:hypothetical protein
MSSNLVVDLSAGALLAILVPAGARDRSAPPPATVAAESSRPATANGSIIELEPMELPLAATVLGEEVRTSDAEVMQEIVLTRLLDRYAEERGIKVTDAEIDAYVENLRRAMRAEEVAEVEQMRRDMGRAMIRQ